MMKNGSKPKEIIAEYPYSVAYKQGGSYYAEGMLDGKPAGRQRCKNADFAKHHAQHNSDSLAAMVARRAKA
jgi:hypothetical protein